MNQIIKASMLFLVLSTSAASAVTSEGPAMVVATENLLCTRDFNPWGLASQCQCPEESTYEQRIGRCIIGNLKPIAVQGFISPQMVAIGGETTGVVMEADVGNYELVLPLQWRRELEESELIGRLFTITGDYIAIQGVAIGMRPTIIVNTLTVEEDSIAP